MEKITMLLTKFHQHKIKYKKKKTICEIGWISGVAIFLGVAARDVSRFGELSKQRAECTRARCTGIALIVLF